MKCLWLILLPALCSAAPAPDPELTRFEPFVWKSEPPGGCPFPPSATITGIKFLGRAARYTRADTWYPSWASDGNLYSNFTDGTVNGVRVSSVAWTRPEGARLAVTGNATILGDDPMNLKVTDVGVFHGDPTPYGGRYPSANLWHNGIWYYGTYTLADADGNPSKGLNWDILGPFVGFRFSRDNGRTWMDTPHTPRNPIFLEPARPWGAVKFGAPHFVDFGRNMEHSPDRKAYLVGHGARDGDSNWRPANASWVTGDEIYIARVTPTPETINDLSAWEFFAGHDTQGRAVWSRDFRRIRPIMEWNNKAGNVSITYNPVLKKYLMLVTDGTNTIGKFHTYLLESNHITGPWHLSVYMKNFGQQAYFVNIPSKFLAADGRTAWLCYAANFSNGNKDWPHHDAVPPGGGYGMTLQEIRLLKPGEK